MNKIMEQNAWLILLVLGLIVFLGGLMARNTTVDLQMHSTYFVIGKAQIGVLVGGLLLFQALVYKLLATDSLSIWLSNIHIVGAFVISLLLVVFIFASASNIYFNNFMKILAFLIVGIVVLVVFCINTIQGVLKG